MRHEVSFLRDILAASSKIEGIAAATSEGSFLRDEVQEVARIALMEPMHGLVVRRGPRVLTEVGVGREKRLHSLRRVVFGRGDATGQSPSIGNSAAVPFAPFFRTRGCLASRNEMSAFCCLLKALNSYSTGRRSSRAGFPSGEVSSSITRLALRLLNSSARQRGVFRTCRSPQPVQSLSRGASEQPQANNEVAAFVAVVVPGHPRRLKRDAPRSARRPRALPFRPPPVPAAPPPRPPDLQPRTRDSPGTTVADPVDVPLIQILTHPGPRPTPEISGKRISVGRGRVGVSRPPGNLLDRGLIGYNKILTPGKGVNPGGTMDSSRRNFLVAGIGLPAMASASRSASPEPQAPAKRASDIKFEYRTLGKTGLKVTSRGLRLHGHFRRQRGRARGRYGHHLFRYGPQLPAGQQRAHGGRRAQGQAQQHHAVEQDPWRHQAGRAQRPGCQFEVAAAPITWISGICTPRASRKRSPTT